MKKNSIYSVIRFTILSIMVVMHITSSAQGFKVKEFKQNLNDGSAFHAPMDPDGHPCGLIKVRTDNPDMKFRGEIVGDVENKMNEYWVYVSPSSKQLKVNHPNFIPFVVSFADYGIDISPKATYILTLEETKYKKEKTGVTIIVKPEDADLYIDDVSVENLNGNGFYQLYIPKGEHICKMSKVGYRPNVQVVQTGKASQNISVELESVMAELEVKCKTATAEIYIDDELKGNGTWKGTLLAGDHKIEARQQNFNSHIQTVNLAEKETKAFNIPELKRSTGKLHIETEPSNLPIIVDGKSVGNSPCTIDIESGKHYAACKLYGCLPCRKELELNSGESKTIQLNLEFEDGWLKEDYQKAYHDDKVAMLCLACQACLTGNNEEAFFWISRHPDKEKVIQQWLEYGEITNMKFWQCDWIRVYCENGQPEKALDLYSVYMANEKSRELFCSDFNMEYIGSGFLKKKEYSKAIQCYEKAGKYGYEGLGDCYAAKGDKQRAISYYRKCLSSEYNDNKNRVEKKIKELGN